MEKKLIRTLETIYGKTNDALAKLHLLQNVLSQLASSGVCVCYGMTGDEFTETLQQVIRDIKDVNDILPELLTEGKRIRGYVFLIEESLFPR